MAQEPENTDPVADPQPDPITPPTDPPSDPPASGERDLSKLPVWAQAIITDLQRKEAQARDEAAKRRIAEREAEQKRLLEQGEFQKLSEQLLSELGSLRAEQARVQREALARKVAREVLGDAVTDHDEAAKRLLGETEDELREDAKKVKAILARQPAPSIEGQAGRRSIPAPSGVTREQVQEGLVSTGMYPGV